MIIQVHLKDGKVIKCCVNNFQELADLERKPEVDFCVIL